MVPPTAVTNAASSITATSATLNGTVNPNGLTTNAIFEWSTSSFTPPSGGGTPGTTDTPSYNAGAGSSAEAYNTFLTGLTPNTIYYYDAYCGNSSGVGHGYVTSFQTLPLAAPTVTTGSVSSLTATSAVLNGTANPNGLDTTWFFQAAPNPSLSGSGNFGGGDAGTGRTPVGETYALTGVSSNTEFWFRIVAVSAGGTSYGSILSFTTAMVPPTAVTNAASSITATSATLNGTVNPNGTQCWMQYYWGTTPSFGNYLSGSPNNGDLSVGSGQSAVSGPDPL
jgi:hypothetical protein